MGLSLKNVAKRIGSDITGGVQAAGDAVALGAANLTGNTQAANNARAAIGTRGNPAALQHDVASTAQSIATPVEQFGNTIGALGTGVYGLGKVGVASVFGSNQDYQNAVNSASASLNTQLNGKGGLGHQGTLFKSAQEAQNITPGQIAAKSLSTGVQIGTLVAGPEGGIFEGGVTKAAENAVEGTAKKVVSPQAAFVNRVAANSALGAGGNAAQQYADTGKVKVGQVISAAEQNAVGGEAGRLTKVATNFAKDATVKPVYAADAENAKAFVGDAQPQTKTTSTKAKTKTSTKAAAGAYEYDPSYSAYENMQAEKTGVTAAEYRANTKKANYTGPNLNEESFTPEDIAAIKQDIQDNPQSYADMGQKDQMAISALVENQDRPTRTIEENRAANPFDGRNAISEVAPGDYQKARINVQQASQVIEALAHAAGKAADAAGLTAKELGHRVEGTKPIENAAQQRAVDLYREYKGTELSTAHSMGMNTETRNNYYRHDFKQPEGQTTVTAAGAGTANPDGINNIARKHNTLADAERDAPLLELTHDKASDYINADVSRVKTKLARQAAFNGLTEADSHIPDAEKVHAVDIGGGKTVKLSAQGAKEARSIAKKVDNSTKVGRAYDKANSGFKKVLLSISQFHPINISVLKAAPTLALRGHPLMAAKGVFDTFAAQLNRSYGDDLKANAMRDGVYEAAARMGAPIGFGSDFSATGVIHKLGIGEKAIFDYAMPAMHIQMIKGAMADLAKNNIDLDSVEARNLGTRVNEIMGFVNQQARNLDPRVQTTLQKFFLAPQFTRAKLATVKSAVTDGGLEGSYARRAVVGNSAAILTIAMIGSYMSGQKHDNVNDMLLRSIFHPSVPTGLKDGKGNVQEVGLPASYSSEVLGLLGFSLKRGKDGHLGVSVSPGNVPTNLANYARSRLAVLPADGLKVATNTDYAGKPLYDDKANLKTQAIQTATTLGASSVPIIGQGLAHVKAVQSVLPQSAQDVLNAGSPGGNPLVKSAASALGATPRTDKTLGDPLKAQQYYDGLNQVKQGLDRQSADAVDILTGSKKNPVTGKYDIDKTVYDSPTKAGLLLQNPKALAALNTLNQKLQSEGQATDPLYSLPADEQKAYLQHQMQIPGSAEARQWSIDNASWFDDFSKTRSAFFDSLPPGDPNAPKSPIDYPDADAKTQADMTAYQNIDDSAEAAKFLTDHPDVTDQFTKQADYTNKLRVALGDPALKSYPKPDEQTTADLNTLNSLPKGEGKKGGSPARAAFLQSHPNVTNFFANVAVYGLDRAAALDQFQENNDPNSKNSQTLYKNAYNLGQYDIAKVKDANGNAVYSLNPASVSAAKQSDYQASYKTNESYKAQHADAKYFANTTNHSVRYTGKRIKGSGRGVKIKKANYGRVSVKSNKVSLKRSMV